MKLSNLTGRTKNCLPLVNESGRAAEAYRFFKNFLAHNRECLQGISSLQDLHIVGNPFSMGDVQRQWDKIFHSAQYLIQALRNITGDEYAPLEALADRVDAFVKNCVHFRPNYTGRPMTVPLESLKENDSDLVGTKAFNLALMRNKMGLPIPQGFAITTAAQAHFFEHNSMTQPIAEALSQISLESADGIEKHSKKIQDWILSATVPEDLEKEINQGYESLRSKQGKDLKVAMRSSAVGEDTHASFAGQYSTVLDVPLGQIVNAYKRVIASKYAPRAILYRLQYGFDDWDAAMGVICLVMVDAVKSGVVYTRNPMEPKSGFMKISAVSGVGEKLVSGEASPETILVDRSTGKPSGGEPEWSLKIDIIRGLHDYGLHLENYFKQPQDIEWALDRNGTLILLQTRPLRLIDKPSNLKAEAAVAVDQPFIFSAGRTASPGVVYGTACLAQPDVATVPDDSIIVTKSAAPDYSKIIHKIKGIITDIGSEASHLASVAREFGVPALFDTAVATTALKTGQPITLDADRQTVYDGFIESLACKYTYAKKPVVDSPMHKRLREILDWIAPLYLIDSDDPGFTAENCKTIHDIVRFCHQNALQAMFGMSETGDRRIVSSKLKFNIPIELHFIDIGGGLTEGLTTCDTIIPDHIRSIPMQALWRGLTHPGINWSSAINVDARNLFTLMASSAISTEGPPGGESFAIVSSDYVNLSAKFGYHYANIDCYCGKLPSQNHVTLEFAGGIGDYAGKTLRIRFLSQILRRLGFAVSEKGDLLEAGISGYDLDSLATVLDQLGRLLASSRLLDVALRNGGDVERLVNAFFDGRYDFMNLQNAYNLPGFYTHLGDWDRAVVDGRIGCLQDGSKWGGKISSGLASTMTRFVGAKYQQFLDSIHAYMYFPLIIARIGSVADAVLGVRIRPVAGRIDQAGGIAFGIKNAGNYFVLRSNALENNLILFEFINSRRIERQVQVAAIESDAWHLLRVEIVKNKIRGFINDSLLISYSADKSIEGHVGLWTKADSVVWFDDFQLTAKQTFSDLFGDLRLQVP